MRYRRHDSRTLLLYVVTMVHKFRGTLAALVALVLFGGLVFRFTPHSQFGGQHPVADGVLVDLAARRRDGRRADADARALLDFAVAGWSWRVLDLPGED